VSALIVVTVDGESIVFVLLMFMILIAVPVMNSLADCFIASGDEVCTAVSSTN
jgi:hypothetical protein